MERAEALHMTGQGELSNRVFFFVNNELLTAITYTTYYYLLLLLLLLYEILFNFECDLLKYNIDLLYLYPQRELYNMQERDNHFTLAIRPQDAINDNVNNTNNMNNISNNIQREKERKKRKSRKKKVFKRGERRRREQMMLFTDCNCTGDVTALTIDTATSTCILANPFSSTKTTKWIFTSRSIDYHEIFGMDEIIELMFYYSMELLCEGCDVTGRSSP